MYLQLIEKDLDILYIYLYCKQFPVTKVHGRDVDVSSRYGFMSFCPSTSVLPNT